MKICKKIVATVLCISLITGMVAVVPMTVSAAEAKTQTTGSNPNDIVSISAGYDMSAAVRADGSLWTWGCMNLNKSGSRWGNPWSVNNRTQALGAALGNTAVGTPTMVFSDSTKTVNCSLNVSDSNIGGSSAEPVMPPVTTVLRDDDSLWIWGGAKYGVLGNGSESVISWKPTKLFDNVVSYDSSGYHSAAVTDDGSLYMWGLNNYGQLGNGNTENKLEPIFITNNVKAVSLGNYHSIILKKDGTVWACGKNTSGQVGNDTNENVFEFVKVMDNARRISAGGDFSEALSIDGNLYVWGNNTSGQLGLGNKNNQLIPCLNENFDGDVISIDSGDSHSAVILTNGDLYIWGENWAGQLGNSSKTQSIKPFRLLNNIAMVSLGKNHSLALTNDNKILAWGNNSDGQLGDHTIINRTEPTEIKLGSIDVSFVVNDEIKKTLTVPWSDAYLYDTDNVYNKEMAISGIVLSNAAYKNPSEVFEQFGYKYADSEYNSEIPSYYIGYRINWNFDKPSINIIMAIRGTDSSDDMMKNIQSVTDNFDDVGNTLVNRLESAEEKICQELIKEKIDISLTKNNTHYFLTGHSLGGACAGKIGLMLVKKGLAKTNNLYVYTYASPTFNTDPWQKHSVPRLFNIVNGWDTIVPNIPGFMYNGIIPIPAYRAGYDIFYTQNDFNARFINALNNLYGDNNVPLDRYYSGPSSWTAHVPTMYLAVLLSDEPQTSVNSVFSKSRLVTAHCPVNVEVYNSNGKLCAWSEENKVFYTNNSQVLITVVEEQKFIQLPDDSEYTIKYIGSDEGSMSIEDRIYDVESGEIESEKIFKNVVLKKDKAFSSTIDGSDTTDKTDLYVIDKEDDKIASVAENGEETVLSKYDITDYDIEIGTKNYKYDGTEKTQEIKVDERLTEGTDYRIIYENNKNVGIATVTVKGINEYSGRVTKTYEIYNNGKIGDDISWDLKPNGILSINGTGEIPDYDDENKAPWSENSDSIKKVLINNGITAIGNNSFAGCENLSDLYIPSSISRIGNNATDGCEILSNVYYEGAEDKWNEINVGENNAKLANEKVYNSEMHIHELKRVEAKEPTYTEEGNSEYFVCESCKRCFSDEEGKNEIETNSWIIPKLTEPEQPTSELTEPITEKSTDSTEKQTEPNTDKPSNPTESVTVKPENPSSEPTEKNTNSTEAPTSEPSTDKPTEPIAVKNYKYLPSTDQENLGYSYKLIVQDDKGILLTYSFTKTDTVLDGVNLYSVDIPESITPTMLIYQFFKGETWVGQVAKTHNEISSVYGNIVKSDGTVYGEVVPTDKPTDPVTDKPSEPMSDEPTEPTESSPDNTAEPTESIKPSDSSGSSSGKAAYSSKKNNPIKVTVKAKTVKLKKLKKRAQTVKAVTIKRAKGKVSIKITSVKKVIKKHLKFNSKGTLTIKRWKKAKKGTYKIKVKITVKGNSKYKPKTIKKTVKIKIK